MSGASGGSVSGAIQHQASLLSFVEEMLNDSGTDSLSNSIVDLVNAAHTTNPYDSVASFDPNAALTLVSNSPLTRLNEQYLSAKTLVDAIAEETDWASYMTAAVAQFTNYEDIDFLDNLDTAIAGLLTSVESALSSSSITAMVTAFENNKKVRFLRDVGLWSGGMADINAVHTSSFIMGLALQQVEFSNSVDQYEREVKGNIYSQIVRSGIDAHVKAHVVQINNKDQLMVQGPGLMASLNQLKTTLVTDLAKVKMDVERLTIIAKKEQNDRQVAIDVDEGLWDMEAMLYAGNILSSITGSAVGRQLPQTPSTAQSMMGGALSGASVGSQFGPWGAAIGAGAGAILGWAL